MHAPESYDLKPSEQQEYQQIVDSIDLHGGLYRTDRDGHLITDAGGNPVPADYVVLRSRRFLVDAHGVLWRFFAEGSSKNPDAADRGGAPWRNNRVEMWTGRWRTITGGDGATTYAKVLSPRPIDKRINGHPGMSQIDWYRTVKGYKHPLDPPREPSAEDIAAMTGGRSATEAPIRARMQAELDKGADDAGRSAGPVRTNDPGSADAAE